MKELEELKTFCKELSIISGNIIKNYWRKDIKVESKKDESPVTIADKKSEEIMRELIMKEFPEHGILGEEFGEHNSEAEYKWILDPIDGTKSFICGTVTFGTLIALTKNNIPIVGVINQPILNEFLIGDNFSSTLNDKKVLVSEIDKIENSVLLTTDYFNIEKYQNKNGFDNLIKKTKLFRMWGDCYGYYLVATGFSEIMIDPIMNVWDSAALIPIINGAGGKITDYFGNDPFSGNSIVATNGKIHDDVIKILNES
ncbi:MAG: histidinol-phosphatase [Melioribacteraceae bacterium]|nr:histidinol-phosphatase [Melioribacteraceae bacterium]